jgi:predicted lysophospholipase L1 biosynthesis ABC-type transport system permease subunit
VIACVNVTNLLLARGVQRRGEFALRAALGAGNGRLVRQLLTESLLLALVGGWWAWPWRLLGVRALVAMSPAGLPRVSAIRVDAAVFAFGLGITTLIGLAFGLIPALQAARTDPSRNLQQGGRRSTAGHRGLRSGLVVAEVALALMLLVGSGLLLREPGTPFCSHHRLRLSGNSSRCRCRRRAGDSSPTALATGSSTRWWKRCARFPASPARHSPASSR